jgi:hypothetical protein
VFSTWDTNLGATIPSCDDNRVWNGQACVCTPASVSYGTNNCVTGPAGTLPLAPGAPGDLAACLAYVAKYKSLYGRSPGMWCETQQVVKPPPRFLGPPIPYVPPSPPPFRLPGPVNPEPVTPPVSTSPVHHRRMWRRPPPRPRPPYRPPPRPSEPSSELCPTYGWVSRDIKGAGEYQVFKCTPGQPVVIDPGLQAVGRQEALARHGLHGLDDVMLGSVAIPTWAMLAGAAVVAYMVFVKRR